MRSILKTIALAVLAISFSWGELSAQEPTISYGTNNVIELVQDQANQRVDFFISDVAGRGFDAFEVLIMIGDGGAIIGGTDTGPALTDIELGGPGTIFTNGDSSGVNPDNQTGLLWADLIDTFTVSADGFAGTMIFDASGVAPGTTLDILFRGIEINGNIFDTNFLDSSNIGNVPVPVSVASNGSITVVAVPEPASSVVILAVAGIIGIRRRR